MDAAGKDSAIKHVMSGVNPQGCQVFSFKHPSAGGTSARFFVWNATRRLPERGRIGIFNRSYYEEVPIVRVHPEILAGEGLPHNLTDKESIWRDRYQSIVQLEKHLHRNGTRVIKFFLYLSKARTTQALPQADRSASEKTGSSAQTISRSGAIGRQYMRRKRTKLASPPPAHGPRPGTWFPRMTKRTPN